MSASERPVSGLISALVDQAHLEHQGRKQPLSSLQYHMFEWQTQEAAEKLKAVKQGTSGSRPSSSNAYAMHGRSASGTAMHSLTPRYSTPESLMSFTLDQHAPPTSSLEITCEYDANFQTADVMGRQGTEVRPAPQGQLGPVAFLFRWYTKRATQFPAGFPRPEDIWDAPPLPPADRPASARASHSGGSTSQERTSQDGQSKKSYSGSNAIPPSALARATLPDSLLATSCPIPRPQLMQPFGRASSGGLVSETSASSSWNDGLPPHGGRSLNRAPDPVMGLTELAEMLEDLEVVPHRVSRQDVTEAFQAAAQVPCTPLNKLPSAQTHPDELRYPQFRDALIRLALAADALQAQGSAGQPPRPLLAPASAVHALMEAMGLASGNVAAFKRKLDALARMAGDRGAKRNAIKYMYVNSPSAMAAARSQLLPLEGWTVDSSVMAPEELHDMMLSGDAAARVKYIPSWKEFPEPALNLGVMQPGEVRCMRVVLRNRGTNTLSVRIDTSGAADQLVCAFNEQPLPPGIPRVMDVEARFDMPGEYSGDLRVFSRTKHDVGQSLNCIPFYALVSGADTEARFPGCKSERGPLSCKSHTGVKLSPGSVQHALSTATTPRGSSTSGSVRPGSAALPPRSRAR